ncbi:MAG: hypothetical protein FWH17_06320 [Oscillospiraceae bacterium]|nr:hypothetical protein [Oscillospiraceae bacterium]
MSALIRKIAAIIITLVILTGFIMPGIASDALADEPVPQSYANSTGEQSTQQDERFQAHVWAAVASLAIAFIVPGIIVGVWTAQLKTVRPKNHACDYVKQGSMNLSLRRDIFLYRNVRKVAKPQNNNNTRR